MADDLMNHKRTIDELRQELEEQKLLMPGNSHYRSQGLKTMGDAKRSSMSINDLVDDTLVMPGGHGFAEAEANLYARILSNRAGGDDNGNGHGLKRDMGYLEPFVKELGLLNRCVIVEKSSGRVVSVRRGSPSGVGTLATNGLSEDEACTFREALKKGNSIVMRYYRNGHSCSCVMDPIDGSDRVIVAEFVPLF